MLAPDFAHRDRLVFGALVLASFALYLQVLGFGFVEFDDNAVLLSHPNLYDESSFVASLYEIFVGYFPREEPLLVRDVTWALDARIFGFDDPLGYHLGNVVLNALNVGLVFVFLRRATRRFDLALSIAALFAVLPVHVEPVGWVMGRKDLLSAFFVLLALLAQQSQLAATDRRRRAVLYGLGLACTALALFSKMAAISCVILLALHRLLHEDLAGRRSPGERLDLRRSLGAVLPGLLPHAALTAAVAIWYGRILDTFGVTGWRGLGPTDPEHLAHVAWFAPLVWARYLRQVFFPFEPSVFYRWPNVAIPLTPIERFGAVAMAVLVVAAIVYCVRQRRNLAFYLLATGALLVPYLGIVYVGFWSADRYVYLASLGPLAIVVTLAFEAREHLRPALKPAIAVTLATFGCVSTAYTLQHQSVWRDAESLWTYEAYREEPSLLAIQALAKIHLKTASAAPDLATRDEAIRNARLEVQRGFERERALGRVEAPYATSEQLNLGNLHYVLGRLAMLEGAPAVQRIEHFEASHAIAPTAANTLMLAGTYYDLAQSTDTPRQEELVARSFEYFVEHLSYSRSDPLQLERNLALLARNYGDRFPYLRDRVTATRESILQ